MARNNWPICQCAPTIAASLKLGDRFIDYLRVGETRFRFLIVLALRRLNLSRRTTGIYGYLIRFEVFRDGFSIFPIKKFNRQAADK